MKKSSRKNLTTTNKSIILKLCLQDDILVNINKLSLEDLIAVKLELSANNINNRLYGFDLWKQSNKIIKEGHSVRILQVNWGSTSITSPSAAGVKLNKL